MNDLLRMWMCGVVVAAAGCGRAGSSTDGNTSWLDPCQATGDCVEGPGHDRGRPVATPTPAPPRSVGNGGSPATPAPDEAGRPSLEQEGGVGDALAAGGRTGDAAAPTTAPPDAAPDAAPLPDPDAPSPGPDRGLVEAVLIQLPQGNMPAGITLGPDGNVWLVNQRAGTVSRLTPEGIVTELPTHATDRSPQGIVTGPDGNVWYSGYQTLGRMTPSGADEAFSLAPSGTVAFALAFDRADNLWFRGGQGGDFMGRRGPDGAVAAYPLLGDGTLEGASTGPDGDVWFADSAGYLIRMTPEGEMTRYPISEGGSQVGLFAVTSGPDGNMWFTQTSEGRGSVGRVTIDGSVTRFAVPGSASRGAHVTAGPDGAIWCTGSGRLWRVTMDGAFTEHVVPGSEGGFGGITAGPDRTIWATLGDADQVLRLTLPD